jgi:L-malate glycosyltransferase
MLTVLIASYNGAAILPVVLDSYCRLQSPNGGWKLVVVDNRSSDNTKEILISYSDRLPLIYCYEAKAGKNAALNTGLGFVEGDLIVLTDDDTLPQQDWLVLLRSAADLHPDFTIFGGPILPKWESKPEPWILSWVPAGPVYGLMSPLEEGPMNPRKAFGGNMAVRRHIFTMGFRFDESIGPNGTQYAQGSESELTRRLANENHRAWHCRNACVHHIIRSHQLQEEWILQRAIRYGRGQFRLALNGSPESRKNLKKIPVLLMIQLARQIFRVGFARCLTNRERLFKERWGLYFTFGKFIESRETGNRVSIGNAHECRKSLDRF